MESASRSQPAWLNGTNAAPADRSIAIGRVTTLIQGRSALSHRADERESGGGATERRRQ